MSHMASQAPHKQCGSHLLGLASPTLLHLLTQQSIGGVHRRLKVRRGVLQEQEVSRVLGYWPMKEGCWGRGCQEHGHTSHCSWEQPEAWDIHWTNSSTWERKVAIPPQNHAPSTTQVLSLCWNQLFTRSHSPLEHELLKLGPYPTSIGIPAKDPHSVTIGS